MPVAKGPKISLSRAVVYAVGSLALGIGLVALVVIFAGSDSVEVSLGDREAEIGRAEDLADTINQDDAPIILASLAGVPRPIYVQHIGRDAQTGWFAFDARSPDRPEDCVLNWEPETRLFVDSCDDTITYPEDGEGLLQYQVTVNSSGNLIIDPNASPDGSDIDATPDSE